MKTLITAFTLFCAVLASGTNTLYDQLCGFNFNWKKYYVAAPKHPSVSFGSDKELIQAHLFNVLTILRRAPTDQLAIAQSASRAQMIAWLDEYRAAGKFPLNYYRPERIPVFIDEHGTHCAVGYLMMMSGHDEMAWRISRADNYVWVKDLKDAGVPAWQEASGLTFEELALIQGAYDFYPMNGYLLADRYETPQQPKCTTAYFTDDERRATLSGKHVWCKGEGKNGVLNGKWEQNYSDGIPWIEGYYQNGKRTGQWKEYYQGTNILCRTERWFNDKLNGTRIRYDMLGNVIEEILFNEGEAVSKINYDLTDSLAYVRIPIDSNRVLTKVYNWEGQMIACGHEIVYNPSGLMWFQNIELTALNSAQVSARQQVSLNSNSENGGLNSVGGIYQTNLYNQPSLVQYKKEGDWIYLRDTAHPSAYISEPKIRITMLYGWLEDPGFGEDLGNALAMFDIEHPATGYDSIHVTYSNNNIVAFEGFHSDQYVNLHLDYYEKSYAGVDWYGGRLRFESAAYTTIKETGQWNGQGERIGVWKYYNDQGALYKTEEYLIPTKVDSRELTAAR